MFLYDILLHQEDMSSFEGCLLGISIIEGSYEKKKKQKTKNKKQKKERMKAHWYVCIWYLAHWALMSSFEGCLLGISIIEGSYEIHIRAFTL